MDSASSSEQRGELDRQFAGPVHAQRRPDVVKRDGAVEQHQCQQHARRLPQAVAPPLRRHPHGGDTLARACVAFWNSHRMSSRKDSDRVASPMAAAAADSAAGTSGANGHDERHHLHDRYGLASPAGRHGLRSQGHSTPAPTKA